MTLRLILGDQLGVGISSLKDTSKKNDLILLCEVKTEATYVKQARPGQDQQNRCRRN